MKNLILTVLSLSFFSVLIPACQNDSLSTTQKNSEYLFLRNENANIPILVEGNIKSKTFIVFIHGGPEEGGMILNADKDFTNPLEEKYAMVYYDQRGMGMASGHFDKSKLTLEQFVVDLEKIVILLKHKYGNDINLFLMGGSWGGMLGTAYLVKGNNQSNVTGWIEIGGAHNMKLLKTASRKMLIKVGQQQVQSGNSVNKWTEIVEFALNYDTLDVSLDNWLKINNKAHLATQLLVKDNLLAPREIPSRDAYNYIFFSNSNIITSWYNDAFNQTGLHLMDKLVDTSFSGELSKVTIPSRFFWGEYDFAVPPALAYDAYNHIGTPAEHKKMVIFPNADHSVLATNKDALQREIFEFVDKYATVVK